MNCPSCWRPIEFEEKFLKVLSCPYCNSVLEFWSWELTKIWEQWDFISFPSQFIVWKSVEWNWYKVYVKWQLRYEYDWGFFDVFYVLIDWKEYYIKEDDWLIKLLDIWDWIESDINLINQEVWNYSSIFWKDIFVQEVWIYKLVNIKWIINTKLIVWKEYEYLDWYENWKMIYLEKESNSHKIRVINEVKK